MIARNTYTTPAHGYEEGPYFSDSSSVGDLQTAVIDRIEVGFADYINSLMVHYVGSTQPAPKRGGAGGNLVQVTLDKDEWITEITGTETPNLICSLSFQSNMGKKWGPYGTVTGGTFVMSTEDNVQSPLSKRMGLLYFEGNSDGYYICQLQATFAEYGSLRAPPGILKFESQTSPEPTTQSTGILSSFARQLMSPIIILRIGPDKTEFRAYEDILCRLAFFRAALHGGFQEASEKAITMPEDEPETIAALIEFLSTGSYTYTYPVSEPIDVDTAADFPASDVAQGAFHVSVYAVASKYDCDKLVQGALSNFTYVMTQLQGLDVIELWKAAYVKGLFLAQFEDDADLRTSIAGLQGLVGDAYRTHREEMETMVSEYPALASDILRLITTAGGSA